MNYNNIIYFSDNIYIKEKDKIIILNIPEDIYKDGIILKEEKFLKMYIRKLKEYNLSTFFWNKKALVIYNSNISINDIKVIKNIFSMLNYHYVDLKTDISFITTTKHDNYLIIGNYYKLIYLDKYNKKSILLLDSNLLSAKELKRIIINHTNKRNLFIIGKIDNEELFANINYYVYRNFLDLIKK